MDGLIEVNDGEMVQAPEQKPGQAPGNDGSGGAGGEAPGKKPAATKAPTKPQGEPAPKPGKDGRERGADGRFVPKEGDDENDDEANDEPPKPKAKIKVRWTKDRDTGEEVDEEIDEDEVARRSAAANGLHRKFEALKAKEKELEEKISAAEQVKKDLREGKDPHRALRKFFREGLGLDTAKEHDLLCAALEDYLHEQNRNADPREKELYEREQKLREEEERRATEEKEAHRKDFIAKADAIHKRLVKTCGEALEQSDLPKTERTLKAMGKVYLDAKKNGLDLTPQELAEETRDALVTDVRALTKGMKGAQIGKLLPEIYREVHLDLKQRAQRGPTGRGPVGASRPQQQPQRRPAREADDGPITFSSGDTRSFREALSGDRE